MACMKGLGGNVGSPTGTKGTGTSEVSHILSP